jgi:hypothetical protein
MMAKRWQPEAEAGPMTTGNEGVHAALTTNSGKKKVLNQTKGEIRREKCERPSIWETALAP